MEAAHVPWRPLGELLVEHGVLTHAELENALAEQQRSGRKLGEIIVEQGCASGPAVTRALAEQWGLELSPERGFGSGLWGEIERRHREKREHQSEELPQLEHKVIEFPSRVLLQLDPGNGGEERAGGALDEVRGRLEESETRVEEQSERVTELEETLAEARSELGRLRARLAERDREVAALSAAANAGGETRAPVAEAAAHLLFVPDSGRYLLLEREGGPPIVGALVELEHEDEDGGAFVVAKLSRSPFPGDRRPCAYLEVAPPPEQTDD